MAGERAASIGRPRAWALAALLLSLAAGCESPTMPGEAPAYDPTALSGGVLFSWPLGRTVAVYVAGEGNAPADAQLAMAVDHALAAWEGSLLYGELHLRRAPRPEDADVIVRSEAAPPIVNEGVCGGSMSDGAAATLLCFSGDTARTLPLLSGSAGRVKVAITVSSVAWSTGPALDALDALVAHELGHALGIAGHSAHPGDVMHAAPTVAHPSERDARTLRYLLHQPAQVRLQRAAAGPEPAPAPRAVARLD